MTEKRQYLDFYGERGIIPVHQDLSDLKAHFNRRRALYHLLGIIPAYVRDKKLIEFGPGTGDNAVFTASLNPSRYVLVDANPASLSAVHKKLAAGCLPKEVVETRESDILDYHDNESYNLVICEGVINGQKDNAAFLRHVASFTAPGALLIATTANEISLFPEVCRRLFATILRPKYPDFDNLCDALARILTPHVKTLGGMSRLSRDWVVDNIMQPWDEKFPFSIPEAVGALQDDFDILGSSPNFITDWRWYKSIVSDDAGFNEQAIKRYAICRHMFLDCRFESAAVSFDQNELARLCEEAFRIHLDIRKQNDLALLSSFLEITDKLSNLISKEMPQTAAALKDYHSGVNAMLNGDENADFGEFKALFGRGMQYLSFVRR